jgi:hypothetical protein
MAENIPRDLIYFEISKHLPIAEAFRLALMLKNDSFIKHLEQDRHFEVLQLKRLRQLDYHIGDLYQNQNSIYQITNVNTLFVTLLSLDQSITHIRFCKLGQQKSNFDVFSLNTHIFIRLPFTHFQNH